MKILNGVSAACALLALIILLFGVKSVSLLGVDFYAESGTTFFLAVLLVLVSLIVSGVAFVRALRVAKAAPQPISHTAPQQ